MMNHLHWAAALVLLSAMAGTKSTKDIQPFYLRPTAQSRLADTPKLQVLTSGTETSLRGLSVVNDRVIWVSGSKGKVGRSLDGGASWQWTTVAGFEKRDFRAIEAFDEKTAVIVAIAEPAQILRTTDGGQRWVPVFTDSTRGMFLDAMDFVDDKHGIVVGDPLGDTVFLATTGDGGKSWKRWSKAPVQVQAGEAFFAASGSNIHYSRPGEFVLVSGGKASRLVQPGRITPLDIIQGREMTGANSIAVHGDHAAIVAGDYENNKDTTQNCVYSLDEMKTWQAPVKRPNGYRSCVIYLNASSLLTCGTSGVDVSYDGGRYWHFLSPESYHTCRKAKKGNAVFLAGGNGRIARLSR